MHKDDVTTSIATLTIKTPAAHSAIRLGLGGRERHLQGGAASHRSFHSTYSQVEEHAALASVAADAERDRLRPRVAPIDLKLEHHQALRLAVVAHA